MLEENGKDNTRKNNSTTWGNKPGGSGERGETKEISKRVNQYWQNRTFQNKERKFYQQLGGHDTKIYQQPDARETEQFWTKIWQPKKNNEKAELINDMTRELEGI